MFVSNPFLRMALLKCRINGIACLVLTISCIFFKSICTYFNKFFKFKINYVDKLRKEEKVLVISKKMQTKIHFLKSVIRYKRKKN